MDRKATVRDVAKLAKVSVSTVSVALNRNSKVRISEATRSRVLEAVRILKYRPAGVGRPSNFSRNPRLYSMRRKIAVLVDGTYESLGDNIYWQVLQGIELAAEVEEIDVVTINDRAFALPFECVGVVVIGPLSPGKSRLIGSLPWVQAMGLIDPEKNHDHITYNNKEMARLGAEYLIRRHDCIGCLCYDGRDIFMQRYQVLSHVVKSAGKQLLPLFEETEKCYSPDTLAIALIRYFQRPVRPTALYIMSDYVTAMAYPILYDLGIRPGRELEIVSCDNEYARSAMLRPCPAVIDICAMDIGRLACGQLLNRLHHPHLPTLRAEIMPRFIPPGEWENDFRKQLAKCRKK